MEQYLKNVTITMSTERTSIKIGTIIYYFNLIFDINI